MGLLDDAIREHLELKRRHGADPGEIAKLEHEAFGPVRDAGDFADAPAQVEDEPEPAYEAEDHGYVSGDPESYEPEPFEDAPAPAPAERPRASAEPLPEARPIEDEPLAEAPAPPAEPDPAAHPEPEDPQATVAFSLDDEDDHPEGPPAAAAPDAPPAPEPAPADRDVVAADDEPGDHDELEETPEFLQETPEHDRLWFEQKPPRDFDF